jgi:hypothetical protein
MDQGGAFGLDEHDGTPPRHAQHNTTVNDEVLVSPAFGVGAPTTLSFWHTYAFEGSTSTCFDAGTLEYTTNGGTSWAVVPAGDITAGGYTGVVNSGYSNPLAGKPAWCGGALGSLTQVTVNLGGDAGLLGKTVQLRWHEGDDSSFNVVGWYVDTVTISNAQIGGVCSTGTGCTAPGRARLRHSERPQLGGGRRRERLRRDPRNALGAARRRVLDRRRRVRGRRRPRHVHLRRSRPRRRRRGLVLDPRPQPLRDGHVR